MRPYRILHVIPSFSLGGAEQMACDLMRGLSATFEVFAVTLYRALSNPIEASLIENGVPIRDLHKWRGPDPRMFFAISKAVREIAPDIIHTHLGVLRYLLPTVFRPNRPAIVHTLHNVAERETDAIGIACQRFAFRRGVVPVAISNEVANSAKSVYGFPVEMIVPNCIPLDRFKPSQVERSRWREMNGFDSSDVIFTCLARLERQKNLPLLLEAFAALKMPTAHLLLVGDGSLWDELSFRIDQLGIACNVHMLGTRNDVPQILAASDVFVLASDWEGSPLSIMEAMASGVPVIATRVGGVPELLSSDVEGLLIAPGDGRNLTEAMRKLMEDGPRRLSLGAAARRRALSQFDFTRMVEGYSSVYTNILEKTVSISPSFQPSQNSMT